MSEELKAQVAAQYRVVAHLCEALKQVHTDLAPLIEEGKLAQLLEHYGERSAYIMETLGDILNNMDAVDEDEDAWTYPIFEEAQRRWPQTPSQEHANDPRA